MKLYFRGAFDRKCCLVRGHAYNKTILEESFYKKNPFHSVIWPILQNYPLLILAVIFNLVYFEKCGFLISLKLPLYPILKAFLDPENATKIDIKIAQDSASQVFIKLHRSNYKGLQLIKCIRIFGNKVLLASRAYNNYTARPALFQR